MDTSPSDDDPLIDEWLASAPVEDAEAGWMKTLRHPLSIASVVVGLIILAGMYALRPTGTSREEAAVGLNVLGAPSQFFSAEAVDVDRGPCTFDSGEECTSVHFIIGDGPDTGQVFEQMFSGSTTPDFDVGSKVVLGYQPPNGVVVAVEEQPCTYNTELLCQRIQIRMTDASAPEIVFFEAGDGVANLGRNDAGVVYFDASGEVVGVVASDVQTQYRFSDFERSGVLLTVFIVFAVAVIALGRWRGVAALVALGATLAIVMAWLLPAILDGRNPVLVALVGASAISYLALYVSHGFNLMSTVALFGTIAALALTCAISWATVELANFTGFATEESTLLVLFQGVDIRGLVLAGMVLGAAGALDDVTITQSSAIWQMKSIDPTSAPDDLLKRGIRIGQHHIGSTVNTLLLAYLGAALPLTILLVLTQQSLVSIANSEVIAIEIVRTLVGSIGLVAAVPVTTWLAVRIVAPRQEAVETTH